MSAENSNRLNKLNEAILPRFKEKEALQSLLGSTSDPVLKDSLEHKIILIRNEIVEKVINDVPDFLESIAYSWHNSFQFDDAYSYVLENLMQSADRYCSTKVPFNKFTSFFWMYNKNLLRNLLKKTKAGKRDKRKTQSFDGMIAPSDADGLPKYDMFYTEDTAPDQLADRALLKSLYVDATPKQKRILKRLYLGYTQSEIAKVLKVTGTNVNTVIRHLRKDLEQLM